MSHTSGRRKSTSIPFSLHLVMLLLSATNIVHARPHHRGYRRFGNEPASKMDSESDKLYNQYYEEFRNVHHRIFKRRTAFEYDNTKKEYETYETDIVDREDHVTQYLSEFLVNTDNEITSLQGSDVEPPEESSTTTQSGRDRFFLFITEEEGVQDVDNVLSQPARTIISESEMYNNWE